MQLDVAEAQALSEWMTRGWHSQASLYLDVDQGRVVKGVNFVGIRDAGDPVEIARRYNDAGADEITFLDITASHEQRDTTYHCEQIASEVFIPPTVGGGVRAVNDIRTLLNAGADKVSINTAAIFNPSL